MIRFKNDTFITFYSIILTFYFLLSTIATSSEILIGG